MKTQCDEDTQKLSHSLYLACGSSYYNMNRFPIKTSLQHFFTSKKIKHRVEIIRRDVEDLRDFNFSQARAKIIEAQRNQHNPQTRNSMRMSNSFYSNARRQQLVDKIPQLSIGKEPLRLHTQNSATSTKKPPCIHTSMYVRKKRKVQQNLDQFPLSKSLNINNPQISFPTEVNQTISKSAAIKKIVLKQDQSRKNKLSLSKKLSQNIKVKKRITVSQSVQLRKASISSDKIKGWQDGYVQKQQEYTFGNPYQK